MIKLSTIPFFKEGTLNKSVLDAMHVNVLMFFCKMDQHKLFGTQSKKLKENILV